MALWMFHEAIRRVGIVGVLSIVMLLEYTDIALPHLVEIMQMSCSCVSVVLLEYSGIVTDIRLSPSSIYTTPTVIYILEHLGIFEKMLERVRLYSQLLHQLPRRSSLVRSPLFATISLESRYRRSKLKHSSWRGVGQPHHVTSIGLGRWGTEARPDTPGLHYNIYIDSWSRGINRWCRMFCMTCAHLATLN